ncbi:MAG: ATP-binding protein [bacterium]|nr:ATP-binding protein [bacterium]
MDEMRAEQRGADGQDLEKADLENEKSRELLKYLRAPAHRSLLAGETEWLPLPRSLAADQFFLCHIDEIMFEEKAPRREALENILGAFRRCEAMNFIYIILGDGQGKVDFYFGVGRDLTENNPSEFKLNEYDLVSKLLKPSIEGNFRGSQVTELGSQNRAAEKAEVLERMRSAKYFGVLTGVPGADPDQAQGDFQGVDRLIDVMGGSSFGFVVLAQPYTEAEMDALEADLLRVFDLLAPLANLTRQFTEGSSDSNSASGSISHARQSSHGVHQTESQHESESSNRTDEEVRHTRTNQVQASAGSNTSEEYGQHNSSTSSKSTSNNKSSGGSSNTQSESDSENYSAGHDGRKNYSTSSSEQRQYSDSYSTTDGSSQSSSSGSQTGSSRDDSFSTTYAHHKTRSDTSSSSRSVNLTVQLRSDNREASGWSKYLDDVLLPRLDRGRGKGLFLTCAFLFSDDRPVMYRLANTAMSLYSSQQGNRSALSFAEIERDSPKHKRCYEALQNLQIPHAKRREGELVRLGMAALSQKTSGNQKVFCGSWLSAEELGILTGLPQRDVIGLGLRREVEFGLNVPQPQEDRLELGHLVQCGTVRRQVPIALDRRVLDKHTFVAGVTGSGKTTTCQKILRECGVPFLVIEPVKTEYRTLYGQKDDQGQPRFPQLTYFTPGQQDTAPFYLNPFELFPGEPVSARADMIKATMEAAFEMEAAIPQILEAGVYRAYEYKGWNVSTDEWFVNGKKEDPFAPGSYAFPTLTDFKKAVEEVTIEQEFGERLQAEYLGSLRARINSLMVGAKGLMLNTPRSVNFRDLIHRQVVIELEEIRNGAEKSMIMGFIMTNLLQAVKLEYYARRKEGRRFQHITLVEEAHRLFSRFVPGDSPSKRQGVEVFANMLAEVRKYGESLIIVDQIPDKMTPEVLKNTNTKIVHRLFAQDDKEAIGNTMALEDDQKAFLSNLRAGYAIVLTQDWPKAVQVKIDNDAGELLEADDEQVREVAEVYYAQPQNCKLGVLPGLEHFSPGEITPKRVRKYLQLMRDRRLLQLYRQAVITDSEKPADNPEGAFKEHLGFVRSELKLEGADFALLVHYIYGNIYGRTCASKAEALETMLRYWLGELELDEKTRLDLLFNLEAQAWRAGTQ